MPRGGERREGDELTTTTLLRSVEALAREHTEQAIETIAEIMNEDSLLVEPQHRLRAAEMLLDRAHGKPTSVSVQLPANRRAAQRYAQLSDDELMEAIDMEPLPSLAQLTAPEPEPIDPLLL
jgi:hypothetical protein